MDIGNLVICVRIENGDWELGHMCEIQDENGDQKLGNMCENRELIIEIGNSVTCVRKNGECACRAVLVVVRIVIILRTENGEQINNWCIIAKNGE